MGDRTARLPCATLHDPWASLCVAGIKTLETRKGALLSGFTGPLVIHRSAKPCVAYDLSRWGVSLPARPVVWPQDDRGMALGVVYVEETSRFWRDGMFKRDLSDLRRRACFEDLEGRYLSELTRAAWFPAPIVARGMQGRWQIEVPRDYLPEWALVRDGAVR